jgi:FlaA1/EpsC-like NDP-sugar epimerase
MARAKRNITHRASALLDIALVILAMAVAYYVRFNLLAGIDNLGTIYYHLFWAALISPVFVFLYGLMGASNYRSFSTNLTHLLGRTIAASAISVCILIVCVFVFRLVDMSRLLLVLFWCFSTLFACLKTIFLRYQLKQLHTRGLERLRVVVVGSGISARHYSKASNAIPPAPTRLSEASERLRWETRSGYWEATTPSTRRSTSSTPTKSW